LEEEAEEEEEEAEEEEAEAEGPEAEELRIGIVKFRNECVEKKLFSLSKPYTWARTCTGKCACGCVKGVGACLTESSQKEGVLGPASLDGLR
jgi:hypothetical protein